MPGFFATCARGLEPHLAAELTAIGASGIKPGRGGVEFSGDAATLYKAALHLRTAVRVLEPLAEFTARHPDELYDGVRSVDWSRFITVDGTLAVDSNVRDSFITHSQFAARVVKDGICDQFRDRTGLRPSVDTEKPHLGLNLHIARNHAILSRDASWDSLHKRGYRPVQTRAPLNEALAAGLLMAAGWDGAEPLADLLCGGGTILIEGAWIATHRPPGLTRPWFSFFGWPDFDRGLWSAVKDDARGKLLRECPVTIEGYDHRADAIEFALGNARTAGVFPHLKLFRTDLRHARPMGQKPGLILVNPPYGERIGEERELEPLYRDLGRVVKEHWPGWRLAVLTLHERLADQIELKRQDAKPFYNGKLPCKLHLFEPAASPL